MPLLDRFKNIFKAVGPVEPRKPALPSYVFKDVDPLENWNIVGELGDGAFGKVQKAQHKIHNEQYAAAKVRPNHPPAADLTIYLFKTFHSPAHVEREGIPSSA